MDAHLRELIDKVVAGKLGGSEARQAIAQARLELTADHQALLRGVTAIPAQDNSAIDHQVFLRDLNAVLTAETALRRRVEPIETYRGVEIYAITLGVLVMKRSGALGCGRFKCTVRTAILIDNSRDGVRRMIDEALDEPRPSAGPEATARIARISDASIGRPEIIVIGAGINTKAIIAAARQSGSNVRAIYVDDRSRWGQTVLGVPISGPLSQARSAGLPAVLAIDDPLECKATAERLELAWTTVIHPTSAIMPAVSIGLGCVIMEAVIIQPSVIVGRHVVVAANATIAHDCTVEDFVSIGAGVDLAGYVHVEEGATLQVGAVVIPSMRVGKWTTIGPRAR